VVSIQRQIRRLPVRRRQQLLEATPRRFSGVAVLGRSYVGAFWVAGISTVAILGIDWLVAMLFDQSVWLGATGALLTGVGLTAVSVVVRRVVDRVRVPRTRDPLALRAAVHQEMALAGDRPPEVERIELRAARAWGRTRDGGEGVLVVDCGPDGVACIRGEAVGVLRTHPEPMPAGSTGSRISLEVLRLTQSVISAAARGQRLPLQPLPEEVVASLREDVQCEVLQPTELPPALAELVGTARAYR
jgi:hypothetical protein